MSTIVDEVQYRRILDDIRQGVAEGTRLRYRWRGRGSSHRSLDEYCEPKTVWMTLSA